MVNLAAGKNKSSASKLLKSAAALGARSGPGGWLIGAFAAVATTFFVLLLVLAFIVSSSNAACETGGEITAGGKNNTQIAYNYLASHPELGLKPFQAAAPVGNFIHESGGDPIKTNNPNTTSGADGIAHWYATRLEALKNHKFQGREWTDIHFQLDFLKTELLGGFRGTLARLQRTTTIDEATILFEKEFEISGVESSWPIRITHAKSVLRRFGNGTSLGAIDVSLGTLCADLATGIGSLTLPAGIGPANPYGYVQMPESPSGAWRFDAGACPAQRFGKPALLAVLATVSNRWKELHPRGWIKIGDLNASGHRSHNWGVAVDLNAFTDDGKRAADMTNGGYNQAATVQLGKLFLETRKVLHIWYNDPFVNQALLDYAEKELKLKPMPVIMYQDNHANHFHLDINDPRGPFHTPGC